MHIQDINNEDVIKRFKNEFVTKLITVFLNR